LREDLPPRRSSMEQTMEETTDRVARERHRIDALHDAIAILIAEISQKDRALQDSIVRRLRVEEQKMEVEYPPDERGLRHPRPTELSSLCDSIQRFGRLPPV